MKSMRTRLRTGGVIAALGLMLAACSGQQSTAEVAAADERPPGAVDTIGAEQEMLEGWTEVRPEPNVSLQLRDGWSAGRAEQGKGPIIFTGPDGARVVVWPMFVASSAKAPTPEAVLIDFAKKEGSPMNWGKPSPLGNTGVRMFGESGNFTAQASFVYANSKVGMVGYWYLTSAPRAKYAELRPVFSGLMKGVKISGSAGSQAAAPPPLTYTSWREPNEAAYTTEVPKGWRVTGGIIRPATLRLLDIVEMTSPDGKAYAFSGDPNLLLYKTPTQMEAQIGLVEGMRNGEAILMRYRPAVQLISGFVEQRIGRGCAGLKLGKVEADERLTAEANRALQASTAPGQMQRMDVATAEFACGDDKVGVVQMATYLTGVAPQYGVEGFGIWSVAGVAGIVAPRDRAVETGQALIHMLQSRKVNPVWSRANAEMVAQINTISQQAANDMSARIASRYSPSSGASTSSGARSDDLSRQWQNSTMDQTDVVDQATGQTYKVDSGSSYYWINGQGTAIAGTNTPSQPSVDFNLMTQLP